VREIMGWLSANSGGTEHATSCLSSELPAARRYADRAAGVLSVLLPDTAPACLVWFRPERVRTVSWGGNPEAPKPPDGPGARLGPRRSFELWKQTVQWTCEPWSEADLASAAALRRAAIESDLLAQLKWEKARRSELARSNRELDLYAHVIAHDLIAPVRGIVAFSELLEQEVARGELEQASSRAGTVRRSALALSELVRSLHEYSRAGRIDRGVVQTELSELVARELERLGPYLQTERARVEIGPGLARVRCDRVRIGTVLSNLIINAVKYNSSGEKRVRIFGRPGTPPAVCVADNGPGIAPEEREHVFELFVRLHRSGEVVGGSGMGLAIARKIVEMHGGRIWVEDTPGGGATVIFTLAETELGEIA
jgi:light-regulated signal transduction histidine kinase (bacteriophytochrome)